MFNSKHKPVQFTRQVDPNAVQNAMEIALKRYEQDLADKKSRRKQELDNIELVVEKEKAKEQKEKEAVTNLKKFQMKSLDDQVEEKKQQEENDRNKQMRKTANFFGPRAPAPDEAREMKQRKLNSQKRDLDR